ncbi:MAG: class I SAM-dependent methyltransferase [Candidatus Nealsonbacteria bacterium]|nr:class I SAM-dependent methyltransferase [Candidatus Nealsonbacteria bacterium]
MDKAYAQYLLEETKKNYDLIAEDYARTRAFVPDDIKSLGQYTQKGEKVLDMGCANGRLFDILRNKNVDFFGIDASERLIEIARSKYPEAKFQVADALNLPFPENYFNKVYSISVIHHIPSKELQLRFLKEARRVLKPQGLLIMRVWDFWQRKKGIILFLKYAFLKIIGRSKLDFKDVFLPWKNSQGGEVIQRYFHCFTKKEIENLIKEAGFEIKKSWRAGEDPRTNIYIVAEN